MDRSQQVGLLTRLLGLLLLIADDELEFFSGETASGHWWLQQRGRLG